MLRDTYLKTTRKALRRGSGTPEAIEADLTQGILRAFRGRIVYADPMDLTKMLNIEPGLYELVGVSDTHDLFYPSSADSLVASARE